MKHKYKLYAYSDEDERVYRCENCLTEVRIDFNFPKKVVNILDSDNCTMKKHGNYIEERTDYVFRRIQEAVCDGVTSKKVIDAVRALVFAVEELKEVKNVD